MKCAAIALLLVSSLILGSFAAPKRAEAAIGGIMSLAGGAGVPVIIAGGVLTVAGVVGVGLGLDAFSTCATFSCTSDDFTFVSLAVTVIGLVVLDDSNGQHGPSFSFGPLTAQQAAHLNLTAAELNSYNAELDEINAISQQVVAEVSASGATNARAGIQASAASWNTYKDEISPETFSALTKVSLGLSNLTSSSKAQP